ncbi:DUF3987 domain-containing protein [Salinarimonas soli]|uniref:DUF3987 domain-containing protein n=1 Tax=Salinarimonas soli TaxID=1638099 RepID=A0A5B2VSG9_9HYPH|nr:DUF3987 domain-containing protein [Salinarimonas soli]KAA2241157.1 DUF3987 domain-containing protein [Salinarimonas soli]
MNSHATPLLDAALSYAGAGIPVFPVALDKTPLHKRGFHIAETEPSAVRALFGAPGAAGVGIPMGPLSGVWSLDIDREKIDPTTGGVIPAGEQTLAALVERHGSLPATIEQRTGGGGRQLLFKWSGERIRSRARDLGPGLDTRGVREDGTPAGYIVVPPSRHLSGGFYTWLSSTTDFSKAASAPLWLVFLCTFNKRVREALAGLGITGPDGFSGLPPSDWPDQAARLLADANRERAGQKRNGFAFEAEGSARERYALVAIDGELEKLSGTMPGAQDETMNATAFSVWCLIKSAGLEARSGEIRAAYLDACRSLPNGAGKRPWTKQDFLAKWERAQRDSRPRDLSHVGQAKREGFGPNGTSGTRPVDEDDNRAQSRREAPRSVDWGPADLSLLGSGRRAAPPFPLEALGPFWAEWSTQRAHAASAPVDYVATALLTSAGALIANVRWPVAGAGWSEPPVLWMAEVGPPGASKSPAIDAVLRIVGHAEDRLAAGFEAALRDHETKCEVAKVKFEAWKAEIALADKNGVPPPPKPDDAGTPEAPVRPRVRVGDATTEKLAVLAAGLPRGLLLVRDELSGWFGSFNRYNGGGADRAFGLEAYGGRSFTVDRMKNPEPIRIRHLSVGVLGGVQPDKVSVITDGPDDGMASRLLWSWPDDAPVFRLARDRGDDRAAQEAFGRLADLPMGSDDMGRPEPIRLPLERAAEDALEEFARDAQADAANAAGLYAGALGKARGHVLRLSCILEHLWWAAGATDREPREISARAVMEAAGLMEAYFLPMAARALGDAAIPEAERHAMALARQLRRDGHPTFNARTVGRTMGTALRDPAKMKAACDALVEAGLIRRVIKPVGTNGRPPLDFEVNPLVLRRAAA